MRNFRPTDKAFLTDKQKESVRKLRAQGMDYATLRERFGCSQSSIVRALKEAQ